MTFEKFVSTMHEFCGGTAAAKGYNTTGVDGHNAVYHFVQEEVGMGTHAHGLGEIIYKVLRYQRRRNPEDLVKIAAWAFLVWKHHLEEGEASREG
jgi:hypothetical protein